MYQFRTKLCNNYLIQLNCILYHCCERRLIYNGFKNVIIALFYNVWCTYNKGVMCTSAELKGDKFKDIRSHVATARSIEASIALSASPWPGRGRGCIERPGSGLHLAVISVHLERRSRSPHFGSRARFYPMPVTPPYTLLYIYVFLICSLLIFSNDQSVNAPVARGETAWKTLFLNGRDHFHHSHSAPTLH